MAGIRFLVPLMADSELYLAAFQFDAGISESFV